MNNEPFKTLKRASLASALGVFAFTYAGSSEANDDVIEVELTQQFSNEVEQKSLSEDIETNPGEEIGDFNKELLEQIEVNSQIEISQDSPADFIEIDIEEVELGESNTENHSYIETHSSESNTASSDVSDFEQRDIETVAPQELKETSELPAVTGSEVLSTPKVEYNLDTSREYPSEDFSVTHFANDYPTEQNETTNFVFEFQVDKSDNVEIGGIYHVLQSEDVIKEIELENEEYNLVRLDLELGDNGYRYYPMFYRLDKNSNKVDIFDIMIGGGDYDDYNRYSGDYADDYNENIVKNIKIYNTEKHLIDEVQFYGRNINNQLNDYLSNLSTVSNNPSAQYKINKQYYEKYYESNISNNYFIEADVAVIVEESLIMNDDLSQNYINHIAILDNETSQLLSNVSFVGGSFDDRLNHVLMNINKKYITDYIVVDQVLISRETSGVQINNYANYFTTDSYEIYVSNNSTTNYPFDNRPFLPEHSIYDNHYENPYGLMQINILDSYGNYLYSGETFDSYTVDELIREVMSYIDSEEYYYEYVNVSNGIMIRTDYYGEYQGIDVYVGNRADESNEVPLPEEPSMEVPVEEITEQPDPEESADDTIVEQPDPEESADDTIVEQPDPEEPADDSTVEQPDTEEPADDSTVEQPDTEEPTDNSTVEQPDIGELVEESMPVQPDNDVLVEGSTPEQTDTDNEDIVTETSGTENSGTDSVTLPSVYPVLPGADVISGVAVPESTGTITLPDGTEVTAESDSEGNWTAKIPVDSKIETGETLTVVFYDEKTGIQPELDVTVTSNDTTHEEAAEEELLPDTGEAIANTGIIAAASALLGGVLLFVTGRRKVSKK